MCCCISISFSAKVKVEFIRQQVERRLRRLNRNNALLHQRDPDGLHNVCVDFCSHLRLIAHWIEHP